MFDVYLCQLPVSIITTFPATESVKKKVAPLMINGAQENKVYLY